MAQLPRDAVASLLQRTTLRPHTPKTILDPDIVMARIDQARREGFAIVLEEMLIGEVVVGATKPGLARIGADKCRVCHKVQHASWAASGHAKRTPPLDCEGCHGPGSEYKALAVMKDPKKARAAGLVDPDAAYCGRCHKGPWDPALLRKAHAHKG